MFSTQEVKNRITALGGQISNFYYGSNNEIILIGLLRGSFIFIADLCRAITVPHKIDFMTISSYENTMSTTKNIKIVQDLDEDIYDKIVLIVEDIIDSGYTINKVCKILSLREPKSLTICTLLDKPERREVNIQAEYIGFSILNEFVVGYGMDYAQKYRHLPYIGKILSLEQYYHNIY